VLVRCGWLEIVVERDLSERSSFSASSACARLMSESIRKRCVPYIPLGEDFQAIAVRNDITGVLESRFPLFWNMQRT